MLTAASAVSLLAISTSPALAGTQGARPQASPYAWYLVSTSKPVITSTGQKLHLTVGANFNSYQPTTATVTVTLATTTYPFETNTWSFTESSSTFTVTRGSAAVTLTSKEVGAYGPLTLKFTNNRGSSKSSCSSGSGIDYHGVLSGNIRFNTNSRWGTVSEKGFSFGSATKGQPWDTLSISNGCVPKFNNTYVAICGPSIQWYAQSGASVYGMTVPGQKAASFSASDSWTLKLPKGTGTENAFLSVTTKPETWSKNLLTAPADSVGGKYTSGTATLLYKGPVVKPVSVPCKSGKVMKHQRARTYPPISGGGTLTFGTGTHPIVVMPVAAPKFVILSGENMYYSGLTITTYP